MKVYTPGYSAHAGKWIYEGYRNAWKELGYDVVVNATPPSHTQGWTTWSTPHPLTDEELKEEYVLMCVDGRVKSLSTFMEAARRSYKTFIFAQPNSFPAPWGSHSNFVSTAADEVINTLNQMDNVYLWTFGRVTTHHHKWKKVNTIPLAFDPISYLPLKNENYNKYDICFVGGWANNGFNEKRKIMVESFNEFKKSGLKCGFFIGKNLTHEQENMLLYNSKISLNIHDAYQRVLGNDTNERTFKSLGLNGALISDKVEQLESIFPNVKTSNDPKELVRITKEYLSLTSRELNDFKEENRQMILDNHCYTHRVKELLSL